MTSKKKLSIGITVNLENYENLRIEVDGEVETQADADDLVVYLDGILARMGRNDPATARRVDSYRERVLERPTLPPSGAAEEAFREEPEIAMKEEEVLVAQQPVIEEIKEGNLTESLYHTPSDAECVGENSDHAGERVAPEEPEFGTVCEICNDAARAPETAIPPKEEEAKTIEEERFVCSICGESISKAQEQLSQLFMGKTLCKKCMDMKE